MGILYILKDQYMYIKIFLVKIPVGGYNLHDQKLVFFLMWHKTNC